MIDHCCLKKKYVLNYIKLDVKFLLISISWYFFEGTRKLLLFCKEGFVYCLLRIYLNKEAIIDFIRGHIIGIFIKDLFIEFIKDQLLSTRFCKSKVHFKCLIWKIRDL